MGSNEVNTNTSPPPSTVDAVKSPPPPDDQTRSSSDDDDEDAASHNTKKPEGSTQPPPNQEMERGYRIPASVFERNKLSTPGDWSVASNESLFSLHMSFTNDQYNDIGPPASSDQMFSYSPHSSRELGLAEATMLEVIKENEGRSPPIPEIRNARRSAGSNQSNMSFAFSV